MAAGKEEGNVAASGGGLSYFARIQMLQKLREGGNGAAHGGK